MTFRNRARIAAAAFAVTAGLQWFSVTAAHADPTGCQPVDFYVGGRSECPDGDGSHRVRTWCHPSMPGAMPMLRFGPWVSPGQPSVVMCDYPNWPVGDVTVETRPEPPDA